MSRNEKKVVSARLYHYYIGLMLTYNKYHADGDLLIEKFVSGEWRYNCFVKRHSGAIASMGEKMDIMFFKHRVVVTAVAWSVNYMISINGWRLEKRSIWTSKKKLLHKRIWWRSYKMNLYTNTPWVYSQVIHYHLHDSVIAEWLLTYY